MSTRRVRTKHQPKRSAVASAGLAIANNPLGVLVLMSLFMVGITGAYWYSNGMQLSFKGLFFMHGGDVGATMTAEDRSALSNHRVNRKFKMGGVHLGMTQEMVQGLHPKARVGVDRSGDPVMTIPTRNGMMVAWLFQDDEIISVRGKAMRDDTKRIYRLRLDEAFATLSESDIMVRYGQEYGRPLEATCTRAGLSDTPRCAYRWWGGDGIELQAIAKGKLDLNGRAYTQMTTIATNTIKNPKAQAINLLRLPSMRMTANN